MIKLVAPCRHVSTMMDQLLDEVHVPLVRSDVKRSYIRPAVAMDSIDISFVYDGFSQNFKCDASMFLGAAGEGCQQYGARVLVFGVVRIKNFGCKNR